MSIRKSYTDQFKRDAVRLVIEEGYTKTAAGRALGVCHTSIAAWMRQFRGEVGTRTVFASKEDEIASLRAEVSRLRMERDILKRAATYFAKASDS
jgi:transposase